MAEATKLYDEAKGLVERMQNITDPETSKKLVSKKPEPNVALAAAGLGMHRGVYKNAQRAMSELNNAYAGKIPNNQNPKAAKEWKDRFARYEELAQPSLSRTASVEKFVENMGVGMKKVSSFVGDLVKPVAAAEREGGESPAAKVEAKPPAPKAAPKVEAKAPVSKGAKAKAAKAQAAKDAPAPVRSPAPWFACFIPCWQPARKM